MKKTIAILSLMMLGACTTINSGKTVIITNPPLRGAYTVCGDQFVPRGYRTYQRIYRCQIEIFE